MELKGSDAIMQKLKDIADSMGNVSVTVGFIEGATYANGIPVAAVAYWNEFGVPSHDQPPRPFFRQMIAKESPTWPKKMAGLAKSLNYDGKRVMELMGQDVKGALQESINNFTTPKLADSTIAAKGFSKPLVATANMLNAVDYEVKE